MQPIATSSVLPVICNEAVDDSENEAEKKSGCLCGFSKQGGRFNNIVDKL